jgi:hypothetical protein
VPETPSTSRLDLLYGAWVLVANAGGGDWDTLDPVWRRAAEQWRDQFDTALQDVPLTDKGRGLAAAVNTYAEAKESSEEWPVLVSGPGEWLEISFYGHTTLTGYVTEITLHGGAPGYRVELPDKVWGGNENAYEDWAATALFSKRPLDAGSVRRAWEARQRALQDRPPRGLPDAGRDAWQDDCGDQEAPF